MSAAESAVPARVRGVQLAALGLGACLALSWRLWLPHGERAPHVPVFEGLSLEGTLVGGALAGLALLALVACLVPAWQRRAVPTLLASLGLLVLADQLRFQPWAWVLGLVLGALALPRERLTALAGARLVLACVYLWSGLHKLNLEFLETGYPWLIEPLREALPASWDGALVASAWLAPVGEALLGLALLTRRGAPAARLGVVAMHVFILAMVGPWGHDWNAVVWPWNLAMVGLVLLLVPGFGRADPLPSGAWRPRGAAGLVLLVLAGLQPALHFVVGQDGSGRSEWDAYPAFGLYSYSAPSALYAVPPEAAASLPPEARAVAVAREDGTLQLGADFWLLESLGVPVYPAERSFRALHRWLTERPGGESIVLIVHRRGRWDSQRQFDSWRAGDRRPIRRTVD